MLRTSTDNMIVRTRCKRFQLTEIFLLVLCVISCTHFVVTVLALANLAALIRNEQPKFERIIHNAETKLTQVDEIFPKIEEFFDDDLIEWKNILSRVGKSWPKIEMLLNDISPAQDSQNYTDDSI